LDTFDTSIGRAGAGDSCCVVHHLWLRNVAPLSCLFFFQAEDGIRDRNVTGVQTCALPICYSIFAVGIPELSYFIKALPLAIAAYIIAFGDVLVMNSLLGQADKVRTDEKLKFSPGRNSIISSIRNFILGIFMPFLPLAGPQWTAGQVLVLNRYMNNDRSVVDSYWGGATGIYWGMSIALLLGPLVTLFQPGINIGMSLTLLIQGYLCGYLAL